MKETKNGGAPLEVLAGPLREEQERKTHHFTYRSSIGDARFAFPHWSASFEMSESTLQHQHQDLRDELGLDPEFVLHSLRHTFLTRLGEQGTDGFTIKGSAGHSSITVAERYVHSTGEAMERAFERLQKGALQVSRKSRKPRTAEQL